MKNFMRHLPYAIVALIVFAVIANPGMFAKPIDDRPSVAIGVITDDMVDDGPVAKKTDPPKQDSSIAKEITNVQPVLESYRPASNNDLAAIKTRLDKVERDIAELKSKPKTVSSNGSNGGGGPSASIDYNAVSKQPAVVQEPMVQICTKNGCQYVPASQAYLYQSTPQFNNSTAIRNGGLFRRFR